jgi:hypothetical protein
MLKTNGTLDTHDCAILRQLTFRDNVHDKANHKERGNPVSLTHNPILPSSELPIAGNLMPIKYPMASVTNRLNPQ